MSDAKIKGILVSLQRTNVKETDFQSSFEELELLADTAGVSVIAKFIQRKEHPEPSTYIGSGKIEEIQDYLMQQDAEILIFNDSLSPVQIRNLEQIFELRVIDRTQLILDIFATRARSKESKLQVELAQLKYILPRLTGVGRQLSRLGGGIGTRGPGETKLETDRRRIRDRISELQKELLHIEKHRQLHKVRRRKNGIKQVVLAGYTNAGKSTILNRLTNASVLAEDRLFATLDPTVRQLILPNGLPVLLIDTVGFIRELPTHLIAAFRSTLGVVREADLILHVIDGSDPDAQAKIEVVEQVLEDLDAIHIPRIKVFNKRDKLEKDLCLPISGDHEIWISALNENDLHALKKTIQEHFLKDYLQLSFKVKFTDPKKKAQLYQKGIITEQRENLEEGIWEISGIFPKDFIPDQV